LYDNTAARHLLEQHPLICRHSGCLCATGYQRELSGLFEQVLSGQSSAQALTLNNGIHHLTLFASVLENSDAAIVLMVDPRRSTVAPVRVLRTLYGLTAKESQLAESLLNGATLEEYCKRRHVTLNTVRSQLKAVYRKTDTSRQAELIRLLSRLFDNVNTQMIDQT
jgi:DNA-binding CsgD family transcriptional regulator